MDTTDFLAFVLALCIAYVLCRVLPPRTIDFFQPFGEDQFTRDLADQLCTLDPRLADKRPYLRFFDGKNRSYTMDKQDVYLCKVDREGNMYDRNQLTLVMAHELAHTICPDEENGGHTPRFFKIFRELLAKATQHGLYDPSVPTVPDYCTY